MDIGSRVTELRKKAAMSREELAKAVGTSGAIIGRYERNDITPSVEVAAKIADALAVSLDYLVGASDELLDKGLLSKVLQIQRLPKEPQSHVLALMDAFLRDFKTGQAYAAR